MKRFGFLVLLLLAAALAQDASMDLPVRHPKDPVPPAPTATTPVPPVPPVPPPPPAPVDDPRDEPPPVFFGEEIEAEHCSIVFVLDASGSMLSWARPPVSWWTWETPRGTYHTIPGEYRWDRAVRELERCLSGLAPPWRFGVVAYPNCSVSVWPGSMAPATPDQTAAAVEWTRAVRVEGATGTAGAVVTAFRLDPEAVIVLLTDGAPNCGWPDYWHRQVIRSENRHGQTVNVFGISAEGQYRAFCQGVAADNGGMYVDVP